VYSSLCKAYVKLKQHNTRSAGAAKPLPGLTLSMNMSKDAESELLQILDVIDEAA